jgi:glucosamine--fructose-6-phosphate aminotransferase (isomerizing)
VTQTLLTRHIESLPYLVRSISDRYAMASQLVFADSLVGRIGQVYLTGCGDSHHAALAAALSFRQLAGLPCEALTAMEFARYRAGFLATATGHEVLVVAISSSGQVSRTIEAMRLARLAGAQTLAVSANPDGALADEADKVLLTETPPTPFEEGNVVVPGTGSYVVSLLALYHSAAQLGYARGHLSAKAVDNLGEQLTQTADKMEETIEMVRPVAAEVAQSWRDAAHFIFCGSGPNYGTALYGAAKILEASGDVAYGQDLEEWAHLEYFARQPDAPLFIVGSAGWDEDRAMEVATAAKAIGRRVAIVAPLTSQLAKTGQKDALLPFAEPSSECFSPLVACIPLALFASHRAKLLDEVYFRNFGGGRSRDGGGGISRIQTSRQIDRLKR